MTANECISKAKEVIQKDSLPAELYLFDKAPNQDGTPKLVSNPGFLQYWMVIGERKFIEFEISNIGGAPAENVSIHIPFTRSWMRDFLPLVIVPGPEFSSRL